MPAVIEAVYENGVFKPLISPNLKERQSYRLILSDNEPEQSASEINPEIKIDPEFAAEIERRTTILPDGKKIVRFENFLAHYLPSGDEDEDWVAIAFAEMRREQKALFEAKLDKYYPIEKDATADK